MPANPRFHAARAKEQLHRDLAHIRAVCLLPLRVSGSIARVPLLPLTLRQLLELRCHGNRFFASGLPQRADLLSFLWRLNPAYAPVPSGLRALFSFRAFITHRMLSHDVARCDLSSAIGEINAFLDASAQDSPPGEPGGAASTVAPQRQMSDSRVGFLMGLYGLSHDEALDLPIAVCNQLYRDRFFDQPEPELNVFDASELLA